jgi:hypothetical protein
LVQGVFALLAGAASVWLVLTVWFPVVDEAVRQLPARGEVRSGLLDWPGESPARLAEGRCLALAVDLDHTGQARSPAHLEVEFGRRDFMILSVFGCARLAYPQNSSAAFNRPELGPWWGAWRPAILALVAVGAVVGLTLTWWLLATFYALPTWLIGLFANRDLKLAGAWRLAGAALMPGAFFLTAAVFGYGVGMLDLVRLAAAGVLHFVIGWIYLVAATLCLPRHPAEPVVPANPFLNGQTGKTTNDK